MEQSFVREMTSKHLVMLSLGGVIGTGIFWVRGIWFKRRVRSEPSSRIWSEYFWWRWSWCAWANCRSTSLVRVRSTTTLQNTSIPEQVRGGVALLADVDSGIGFRSSSPWRFCHNAGSPAFPYGFGASFLSALLYFQTLLMCVGFPSANFDVADQSARTGNFPLSRSGWHIRIYTDPGKWISTTFQPSDGKRLVPERRRLRFLGDPVCYFAFSGAELIGVAAGETSDPKKNIPKAILQTIVILVVLFIGTIVVIGALLPDSAANLDESPVNSAKKGTKLLILLFLTLKIYSCFFDYPLFLF